MGNCGNILQKNGNCKPEFLVFINDVSKAEGWLKDPFIDLDV